MSGMSIKSVVNTITMKKFTNRANKNYYKEVGGVAQQYTPTRTEKKEFKEMNKYIKTIVDMANTLK